MRIDEVWKKGNINSSELKRKIESFFNGKAKVHEVSDDKVRIDVRVSDFIDRLFHPESSRKILDYLSLFEELDKKNDNAYDGKLSEQLDVLDYRISTLYKRILKKSIINLRQIIPSGWINVSGFQSIIDVRSLKGEKVRIEIQKEVADLYDGGLSDLYHVTRLENVPSILRDGLMPRTNKRLSYHGYRNRIYLHEGIPDVLFVYMLFSGGSYPSKPSDIYDSEKFSILKVNVPENIEVFRDLEYKKGMFVEERILPENIEIVFSGTMSEYDNFRKTQ